MESFVGILLGVALTGWFITWAAMRQKVRNLSERVDAAIMMIEDMFFIQNLTESDNVVPFRKYDG